MYLYSYRDIRNRVKLSLNFENLNKEAFLKKLENENCLFCVSNTSNSTVMDYNRKKDKEIKLGITFFF